MRRQDTCQLLAATTSRTGRDLRKYHTPTLELLQNGGFQPFFALERPRNTDYDKYYGLSRAQRAYLTHAPMGLGCAAAQPCGLCMAKPLKTQENRALSIGIEILLTFLEKAAGRPSAQVRSRRSLKYEFQFLVAHAA